MKKLYLVTLLVAALCLPVALAAAPLASARLTPVGVEWQPAASYEAMVLTVSGPDGVVLRREFKGGNTPSLELFGRDGNPLPDGAYHWELSAAPHVDAATRSALVAARKTGDDSVVVSRLQAEGKLPRSPLVQSGVFSVAGGAIVPADLEEGKATATARTPSVRGKAALTPNIAEDQVIPDDLIVQGSGCFGFDCVNNESFGFDTIRMKENNTRIKFEDTSVGTFPTNDWQLTANDSASGGASKFSIEDITGAKVPFTVTAGASTNSIFVDSTGRVGFRTSTPVLDLHVNTSNTPSVRLEQNNSGGFTAQTWDIAGNEANFFVRDVTSGSRLPFRIRPGAPTSSVDISADGDVGIGTASPDAKLDIEATGSVDMRFTLTGSNVWRLVNDFNGFGITFVGSGLREFNIGGGGNVTISGTLTQGSSRDIKDNFLALDPKDVLAKVSALPLTQWSYKSDGPAVRHIGPMAEDFHKTFGLGTDDKHIAPSDQAGIALVAVQGLNQVVQEKDKEIAELKQANSDLKTRLENLEKMVEKLAAEQQ